MAVALLAFQLMAVAAGLKAQQKAPSRLGPSRLGPAQDSERGQLRRLSASDNEVHALGVMNKVGVTKYSPNRIKAVKRKKDGGSWWPDASARTSKFSGSTDLSDNVSWGWHHPNGVYNTIPVGPPLVDSDMNIYLGSDDSIRKFSSSGELLWVYGPRGQLAAAPSLVDFSFRRVKDMAEKHGSERAASMLTAAEEEYLKPQPVIEDEFEDMEAEEDLAPAWTRPAAKAGGLQLFSQVKARVGDKIKVRPGVGYYAGNNLYRAGEQGQISEIITEEGKIKAVIHWARTGKNSVETMDSMDQKFRRLKSTPKLTVSSTGTVTLLVGSTTSGYVFAMDSNTGEELWAELASEQIHGVKGVVSGYQGVIFAATNRCVDRYCYKYRSLVNPLMPGNAVVRGLLAIDGSPLWSFKPTSPVWNFVPQIGKDGATVMFNDFEGTVYCLDIMTGTLIWKREGAMGTYTQASAVYHSALNQVFAFGVHYYQGEACNPYVPAGIQWPCNTQVAHPGWARSYNASSGHMQWEKYLPEPPASAAVGALNTPSFHTRVVVTMGHNCAYSATSQVWALDPHTGHDRWRMEGPTLWTPMCAGDKEGGDVRRAMGGRAACVPGSWSTPVIDTNGDIYVGSQVGILQRIGSDVPEGTGARNLNLLSTLSTGVAFQDNAITIVPGMMAVSTCTSLIVFQTYLSNEAFGNDSTWDFKPPDSHYPGAANPPDTAPIY